MIRRLSAILALIASTTFVQAQTVPVRSGEHDGFTRLVLDIPAGTGWVLTRRKDGARLKVDLSDAVFDTRSVFSRLSKKRLSGLSQTMPGSPLELEFGCDCAASAFLYKDTMIVVDIAPGQALPPPDPDIPPPILPRAARRDADRPQIPVEDLIQPLQRLDDFSLNDRLMARILQGADREIVDLDLAQVGPRASIDDQAPVLPVDLPAHIEVTSVLDDLGILSELPLQQLETSPVCIGDGELAFESWGSDLPFTQQIAALRHDVFQEFDRVDPISALNLAKFLVHSGFGAEAIQTLRLLDPLPPEGQPMSAIAHIVDDLPSPDPNPLAGMQRCDGDIALWAVLSEGVLESETHLNGIEQSFARLPEHLRRQLGPRLSEIFVRANQLEAARRVLRSVDRIESETRPEAMLAEAAVATAAGDQETSEALLNEVLETPDADTAAPLALARLIEKRWSDRGAITQQQLDLVSAYAVELRNSDMGPVMERSRAVALSLNNEFHPAFKILNAHADNDAWAGTWNRVLLMLALRADDGTFLRHASGLGPARTEALTTEVALAIAERFAGLGFAGQIRHFADAGGDRTRQSDRAILRAQAALLEDHPGQALEELAGVETLSARRLRAEALSAVGDYTAAAEIWRALGENSMATRLEWLSGLQPADIPENDRVGKLVELSQDVTAPLQRFPDKPLADAAALLEASSQTRQQISELLAIVDGGT